MKKKKENSSGKNSKTALKSVFNALINKASKPLPLKKKTKA
jgi:hypothetical protein